MVRSLLVIAALLVTVVYLSRGGIVFIRQVHLTVDPAVKRHLVILVSLFLLSLSFSFVLDRYGLLYHASTACCTAPRTPTCMSGLLMLSVMAVLSVAAAIVVPFFAHATLPYGAAHRAGRARGCLFPGAQGLSLDGPELQGLAERERAGAALYREPHQVHPLRLRPGEHGTAALCREQAA